MIASLLGLSCELRRHGPCEEFQPVVLFTYVVDVMAIAEGHISTSLPINSVLKL